MNEHTTTPNGDEGDRLITPWPKTDEDLAAAADLMPATVARGDAPVVDYDETGDPA